MNINPVIEALLARKVYKATKYISPKEVIRATHRNKPKRRQNTEIVLTIGRPNYRERVFIKACVKSGEPFPVKKIQLKDWPEKRK